MSAKVRLVLAGGVLAGAIYAAADSAPANAAASCHGCGRAITNPKVTGTIVADGTVQRFRTPACMARYISETGTMAARLTYVTDWPSGREIRAERALFVQATVDRLTFERDYLAFLSADAARQVAWQRASEVIDWPALLVRASEQPTD